MSGKEVKAAKRDTVPDVINVPTMIDILDRVSYLLDHGVELKTTIGVKPEPKKNKPGSGLMADLDVVMEELSQIQYRYNMQGLKHRNLMFTVNQVDGRKTLDQPRLAQELLARFAGVVKRGVDPLAIITECFEAATKTGDSYFVREIEVLK